MSIRVSLEHRTSYRFDRAVQVNPHVVRLRPAVHSRTPVSAYSLTVTPTDHFVNWQQDPFGNHLARIVFPEPTTELSFTVGLVADLTVINPFDFFVDEYAERWGWAYPEQLRADLGPYLAPVAEGRTAGPGPLAREWLAGVELGPERTVDALVELNRRIAADVAYSTRMEHGVQTPDETLRKGIGSCRDSAWLLVSVLRQLGLAARFVSGYLVQLMPDAPPSGAADGPSGDFTDLHAWAEVYVPGAGWVGLDSTSGLFAGEGHIPLAATPHPASAAPITGTTGPAEVEFGFANVVRRLHEDPRVTKPYSDEQWKRVQALGASVDERLAAADVRLTVGGEPTFVADDEMDAPEWTTEADGADKRRRAAELARRSVRRWAPGGLVQHGQGKWYPGEPLPRWQTAITWRKDGEPLWSDPSLLGDPDGEPHVEPASAAARSAADRLARAVTAQLGLPIAALLPAYEDAVHALLQDLLLPAGPRPEVDLDPADPALVATAERAARRTELVAALDRDPGHPIGWVLPLHPAENGDWATERWAFRRGRLVLLPGTSPLGLRLPLDAIAWTPPAPRPERSPFEPRGSLPPAASSDPEPLQDTEIPELESAEDSPRTALCVEERGGHLHVFLPPLTELEDALELVAAVEAAAARTRTPVVLEGYPLPADPRTGTLTVTPDPGVIEVNVQPAASWDELVAITEGLDADARACGLATEKFTLDGLHTGTGGGSHVTLGGATPKDSPLLRRPDLLRSMVTFWQHHPALSYLFSGRFVGPTSQAPRVDEARHESLYELEIAFGTLDDLAATGVPPRPWQVDRALRHLLTDITGNTHRAEFCIDKLFSPDSERGRLGLLELRAFEMPPHPRMSLVQNLLIRSLVARFWDEPYTGPLVRWGTELHDRFLAPSGVAADAADVVADLNAHGVEFEQVWLDPFLDFRFPRLGHARVAGVDLELRQAIEPWHVLGEEASAGGTARYVDSSVERVELRASGLVPGRHVITCNGVAVPLGRTGTAGEGAAAIRFTAWAPPSKLHPSIGVQAPLVVDVVDRWNSVSLGGFRYHVSHPGGLAYEDYPVNAAAAESRRTARFEPFGHTPGPIDLAGLPDGEGFPGHGEYPRTLDLRRHGRMPG